LEPFSKSFSTSVEAGKTFAESWTIGAQVALMAAEKQKNYCPKSAVPARTPKRASGVVDPGALSMAMIIEAMEGTWGS